MERSSDVERAARVLRASSFSCALGPVFAIVAFALAVADIGRGDQSILAAVTLVIAFIAVFFGLTGLFVLQMGKELPSAPAAPAWAVPCGVAGIVGGFFVGLFGVIT